MTNEKTIINLDSTVLGKSGCVRALKWKVMDGYTEPIQSANIIYGVAIHKFIDTMYRTKGNYAAASTAATKAFEVPKIDKGARSAHLSDTRHMISVAFSTWETWIKKDQDYQVIQDNDIPMTEYTFRICIYEDDKYIVYLCGTIDTIGKIVNGVVTIRDWKTTSAWDGKEYFSQYEMSRQLRIYALALKLIHRQYPTSLLGTLGANKIGAMIDAIFIKPNPNETKFARSQVFIYGDEELNEIHELIMMQVRRLISALNKDTYPKEGLINGMCIGKWGKCLFWNVCQVRPEVASILLSRDFKVKKFDPLKYNELED